MAATVTLSSTTLSAAVSSTDSQVKVASTSGLTPGIRLWVDQELMSVVSLGIAPAVNVLRGVDGTVAAPHSSSATVTFGRADQFYQSDPVGRPPSVIPISPWINVLNGRVWYAQGDELPNGLTNRWWQLQSATYGTSALGVTTTTLSPTSSS